MLLPTQEIPTLGQLWARGQQVIVSYEDEATVSRYDKLWPAIPYWWGNAVKPDVLLRFLETMKGQGRPGDIIGGGEIMMSWEPGNFTQKRELQWCHHGGQGQQ